MTSRKLFSISTLVIVYYFLVNNAAHSQDNISYELDNHIVYYNIFNSSSITPEIARVYGLNRAKKRAYLNVALVEKAGGYGIAPDSLRGYSRNLLQQKNELTFIEIKEAQATYYLAPIRFYNEEILHVDVLIKPDSTSLEKTFTITKKLYVD